MTRDVSHLFKNEFHNCMSVAVIVSFQKKGDFWSRKLWTGFTDFRNSGRTEQGHLSLYSVGQGGNSKCQRGLQCFADRNIYRWKKTHCYGCCGPEGAHFKEMTLHQVLPFYLLFWAKRKWDFFGWWRKKTKEDFNQIQSRESECVTLCFCHPLPISVSVVPWKLCLNPTHTDALYWVQTDTNLWSGST